MTWPARRRKPSMTAYRPRGGRPPSTATRPDAAPRRRPGNASGRRPCGRPKEETWPLTRPDRPTLSPSSLRPPARPRACCSSRAWNAWTTGASRGLMRTTKRPSRCSSASCDFPAATPTTVRRNPVSLTFYIVDVFAEERYAGNQLAVVRGGADLSDKTLQKIALEMNYSETTFVLSDEETD